MIRQHLLDQFPGLSEAVQTVMEGGTFHRLHWMSIQTRVEARECMHVLV